MDVLVTGNLSSLTSSLVKELTQRKHRLVLVSDDTENLSVGSDNIGIHTIDPADEIFRDAMSSYGFDIVIFIATREEQLYAGDNFRTGHQLDGLWNTLELCRSKKPRHFFYISSTEVYGNNDDLSESATPHPSSLNGHTLFAGEQYCQIYHDTYGINTTILRLANIYGPNEKTGLLYRIITTCNDKNRVTLPASENSEINLLHVEDVTDFLIRAIDEKYTPEAQAVNLVSANTITFLELGQNIQKYYPQVEFHYLEKDSIHTRPVKGSAARNIFDWVDTHTLEDELESIIELYRNDHLPQRSMWKNLVRKLSNYPEILKWIELLGGAALTQYISQLTGTLIQFKYVDFRLLFVVVMGSIYGIRTGLYAAILVCLSILYAWKQLGFDWALLIYNIGNWLPFALYFTAGLITGYYRDKNENDILNGQKQTRLIYDKYAFLYGVFKDIRTLKDEFRERLLGYRDSFGRVFTITRELDQLQEHAIYLRALSILEEQLDNEQIAIYSLTGNGRHARLEANSVSLNGKITKSLELSTYPELAPHIEQGTIFQNTALLPDYPAYVVPIFNNSYPFNVATVMIVIWSVKFEQYTTYYHNQLKVICGLIQASLVRAAQLSDANYEREHLPTTKILNQQAFKEELKIQVEMKKNRVSDFQLVSAGFDHDVQDIYSCISEEIRATDIIGLGNGNDYYILLPQADKLAAQEIMERLSRRGVQTRFVDVKQVSLD